MKRNLGRETRFFFFAFVLDEIAAHKIYFERESYSSTFLSLSVPVVAYRTQLVYKSNECRGALVDYSSGKKKITNIGRCVERDWSEEDRRKAI